MDDRNPPENDQNPVGTMALIDPMEMHREVLAKLDAGSSAIIRALTAMGAQIIRVEAGGAAQSQHVRFRQQYMIMSRATPGDGILGIGTATYTFTVAAVPVRIDFPIVIERGVDITFTGDGRVYLVGFPE